MQYKNMKYGKERLFEMMKNVNRHILKEDFDFNDAERDHLGQQDLNDSQQEDLSKELASLLKNTPDQFNQKIATIDIIPAMVHSGSVVDGMGNPQYLGFRDLEKAGLVNINNDINDGGGEDDGQEELSIISTSDKPIYGIDTKRTYKIGERII